MSAVVNILAGHTVWAEKSSDLCENERFSDYSVWPKSRQTRWPLTVREGRFSRFLRSIRLRRKPQDYIEKRLSGEEQVVKDFVYLDASRLESILAQLQCGLVRELVETQGRETGIEAELGGGLPWLQARLAGRGGVSGEHQASKVLHDYLYSLVEEGLGKRIRDVNVFSVDDWRTGRVHQDLGRTQTDFIRVTGRVKITDFMGLAAQLESAAGLMEAIQRIPVSQQSDQRSRSRGGKGGKRPRTRNQEEAITKLVCIVKEFYADLIVLKIFPLPDNDSYHFTGALSKGGLQDERAHMLLKFGTEASAPWTMLSQVASVPAKAQTASDLQSISLPSLSPAQFTDMADAVEQLMDAIAQVFAVAGMSMTVKYPIIAVTPLAVYRV